jgi:hypothetical protein
VAWQLTSRLVGLGEAVAAVHFFRLGLFLVILEFALPLSMRIPVLRAIASIGLVTIMVADWRTANRWERERNGTDRPAPRLH